MGDIETSAALEEARRAIRASLERVHDWRCYLRLASDGLSTRKMSKIRGKHPLTAGLSDDQIQLEFRRLVDRMSSEWLKQWTSSVPSSSPQQPQQQADVVDHPSSPEEGQQLQGVSEGQPYEAPRGTHASNDGNVGNISQPSASSRQPSTPPSLSNLGQISKSTNAISSPGSNGPRTPQPAGPLGMFPQVIIPISSGNRGSPITSGNQATPASDVPSSMFTRQRGPQSPLPIRAAPRCIAASQGMPSQRLQDAREKRSQQHPATEPCPKRQETNSVQAARNAPKVLLPSQPAQPSAEQQQPPSAQRAPIRMAPSLSQPAQHSAYPGTQQQQLLNPPPVPVHGDSVYLSVSDMSTKRASITVMVRQCSLNFQRRSQYFRIGDRTANQTWGLLSLALELLYQATADPLLSSSLTPAQFADINLCGVTMEEFLNEVENISALQSAD